MKFRFQEKRSEESFTSMTSLKKKFRSKIPSNKKFIFEADLIANPIVVLPFEDRLEPDNDFNISECKADHNCHAESFLQISLFFSSFLQASQQRDVDRWPFRWILPICPRIRYDAGCIRHSLHLFHSDHCLTDKEVPQREIRSCQLLIGYSAGLELIYFRLNWSSWL